MIRLQAYAILWAALIVLGLLAAIPVACRVMDQFYRGGV